MATNVATRTTGASVSAGLSDQVNCVHAHQINQKSSSPWATPEASRWWTVKAVTCVTANTKTRSKNSSTKVTGCPVGAWSRIPGSYVPAWHVGHQ